MIVTIVQVQVHSVGNAFHNFPQLLLLEYCDYEDK